MKGKRKNYTVLKLILAIMMSFSCVANSRLNMSISATDSENLAYGKTSVASSEEANTVLASNAVDGDTESDNSRWGSGISDGPHWIYVDLGKTETIQTVKIFWESRKVTAYKIQIAQDGSDPLVEESWQTVTERTRPESVDDIIDLGQSYEARYVRLYIDSFTAEDPDQIKPTWNTVSIYELEVYAPTEEAVTDVEILSITEEEGKIKLELSAKPEGYFTKPHAGYHTFRYVEDNGKVYAVQATDPIPAGEEFYNVVSFELPQEDENGNLYVNYWMYRDAEGKFTYGRIPGDNDDSVIPTLTIQVGDRSYSIPEYNLGDEIPAIDVNLGETAKVTVEGIDLKTFNYMDPAGKTIRNQVISGNHQKITFDLVDNTGSLSSGYYSFYVTMPSISSMDIPDNEFKGKTTSFNINVKVVTVDKTKLQELYDDVKDYTSDDSYYVEFTEVLNDAKTVLDNDGATQEDVDKAYDTLNQRYWLSKVNSYVKKYRPIDGNLGNFDYEKYEASSTLPVVGVYVVARDHTNTSYPAEELEKLYYQFVEAEKALVELDENPRSVMAGPNIDMIRTSEFRGSFIFSESLSDGKLMLHVEYINDGINVITNEDLGKFTNYDLKNKLSIWLDYAEYDGARGSKSVKNYVEPLEGEADYNKGFQMNIEVDPGKYSIRMSVAGDDTESYGSFYTMESFVDKTRLKELLDEADPLTDNLGIKYIDTYWDYLVARREEGHTVYDDEAATQDEVDSIVARLEKALALLEVEESESHFTKVEGTGNEVTITLDVPINEIRNSEYNPNYVTQKDGVEWTYNADVDNETYTITTDDLPEGEIYARIFTVDSDSSYTGHIIYRNPDGEWTIVHEYRDKDTWPSNGGNETYTPTVTVTVNGNEYKWEYGSEGSIVIDEQFDGTMVAVVEGLDLDMASLTITGAGGKYNEYWSDEEGDNPIVGDHTRIEIPLVGSDDGKTVSGVYNIIARSNIGEKRAVVSFTVTVAPTVDKTKLQALYDDVKDYESTDSYYKYFVEELEEAKKILDDPNATQDQVDMKVDQLSGSYYALLVSELNSVYSPTIGSEDLMKYTTDSLIPVINMWGITHNRTNNNYEENSIIGNVGQMKGWYEEYIKAVEGLEEATLEDHYIGLYEEVTSTKKYQGHFEVVKEEVVEVNGEKKIRLTVQFINDGLHPVYGEELPNANGTTKFEDFSIDRDGDNIHAKVNTYNEELKQQRYTNLANITPLDGNTNYYDGFQGTIDLNPTDKYVTFDFYASSNSYKTYSPWYYRVSERDLTAPNATVTTSNNGAPTNQSVTVTITADESIQEAEGWTLNEDGMTLTKVFDENTTGTLTITDLAGNETEVSYTVSGIDKKAPEIIKIVPNSDGTVTVKFDEPVTIEADEWKESEAAYEQGGQFWVGTLTENKFYDVTAKDAVGNTVEFRVDHEKPEPIVSYSTTNPTNKDVTVTVTFPNEENFVYLTSSTENPGWTNISGTNQWQKVFSANAAETVRFHDSMGNETSVEIKVENIDTTGPELDVEYSTDQPTNASVTVTVKSDEPIDSTRLPEGWTLSEDGLTATKIYDENRNETVIFADKLGNTSEVQISVDNIDKTNPIIELTEKNVIICEGDEFDPLDLVVSVTDGQADLSQSLVIIEEPKIDTDKIGTYVITYQVEDAAGNVTKEIVTLTVNPKMAEINAIPVITANDQTIKVNDTFDVLANVSAADKEDGDLTNNIKVIANDVDTTKPGIYHVTYQVSDSTGGTSTKTITVTVADNTVPTDPEEPSTPDEPDTGEEKPGDTTETPSTSDQSMMSLYIGLLTVSAWMLAVLLRRKREAK